MPKVALIQMAARTEKAENVNHAVNLIRDAASQGAQVICLPEVFFSQFRVMELGYDFFKMAETVPGPTTDRMSKVAAELDSVLVVPIFEKVQRSVHYNTAVVIDATGDIVGLYRKQHIPLSSLFYEKLYFKPGNLGYPVFETQYARLGIYICHDRHYPEGARALALGGAEMILIPVATPTASLSRPVFELEIQAHAVFNEVFVGAVNRVGTEGEYTYYGRSLFAGPDGSILAQAGENEEILIADVNPDEIDERRLKWQFYRERRPHTYSALVEEIP